MAGQIEEGLPYCSFLFSANIATLRGWRFINGGGGVGRSCAGRIVLGWLCYGALGRDNGADIQKQGRLPTRERRHCGKFILDNAMDGTWKRSVAVADPRFTSELNQWTAALHV